MHVDFLVGIVDIPEMERVKRDDAPYLRELTADILTDGVQTPLSIIIDDRGHVCLEDGMHRLAVADVTSMKYLPVLARRSRNNIRRHSRHLGDVIHLLSHNR